MAATVKVIKQCPLGNTASLIVGSIAFDSSYPTGGEDITIPNAEYVHHLSIGRAGANEFAWDKSSATPKVLAYVATTGAEVAAAVDLSAQTDVRFTAVVSGG